jgi:hypothetical protein
MMTTGDARSGLPEGFPAQGLLGYLNFSEGRPDPRFQKQMSDAFAHVAGEAAARPWETLQQRLLAELERLRQQGSAAFQDADQAQAVLRLALGELPAAYRVHHADLLFHQRDIDLLQPFFLARACEAVLAQRGPWEESDRIIRGALQQLNDFVGYRPVAVLEGRRRGELYENERIRPIPLFLRGAGVAWGRYDAILTRALAILETTDTAILAEADFDLDLLDELALDPRGYDFSHPADKRPNHCFGEWDPHHLDNQARFRRYVARQVALDAILDRVQTVKDIDAEELLFEAGAVLAGTVLMAAAVTGRSPQAYDSSVTLSTLVPRIAHCREAFYAQLLSKVPGDHGARLRVEAGVMRQPFGAARRHLNQMLARQRALQLLERHLALLLAEIGYPAASRRQAARIAVASVRMLSEMHILLTTGRLRVGRGELEEAARHVGEVEALVKRGIASGALVDPWNVLGFQGNFPRSNAIEDSVRDFRIDELTRVIDGLFDLYARLLSEAAARGKLGAWDGVTRELRRLANWWDAFATTTVSDIPHVQGAEALESALHVAQALDRWRQRGMGSVDLKFWRDQLEGFRTPKAFAHVVDALLDRQDYRASMGLLMTWLSQAEQVPLIGSEHSFHHLALRWMLGASATLTRSVSETSSLTFRVSGPSASAEGATDEDARRSALDLISRFFDSLEANAEEYWQVPRLDLLGVGEASADQEPHEDEVPETEEESTFDAAYEGVTYKDSADDNVEGELLDIMPQKDFDLKQEAQRIEGRLRFLTALAGLWSIATRPVRAAPPDRRQGAQQAAAAWLAQGRHNYEGLLDLLERIHAHEIPRPTGAFESIVEYDSRMVAKVHLLDVALETCLAQALAVGALQGVCESAEGSAGLRGKVWERAGLLLERALLRGQPDEARAVLPEFMASFRHEPLLYTPLSHGGHPHQVLWASLAHRILRGLVQSLPRQGLLQETYRLVRMARAMEASQALRGPRFTEFVHIFRAGLQAIAEAVTLAARRDGVPPAQIVAALENIAEAFLATWIDQSQGMRISMLEAVQAEEDWRRLRDFIRRYGRDLFTARFLAVANLRGILHRGVGPWLEQLRRDPEPTQAVALLGDLGTRIAQADAERHLFVILQTLLENYDHLRDYNATTAQSDYGENLYQLFDFLRLKASYDRTAWGLQPLTMVHEVLARHDGEAAALWRGQVEQLMQQPAVRHLQELARLEREHGIRLATVTDHLEQRFVKPMAIDRLCALVAPAVREAGERFDRDDPCPLEEELRPLADTPSGVGMDVPQWLARLETELQRVRHAESALGTMIEALATVPALPVPFAQLANQLGKWKEMTLEE